MLKVTILIKMCYQIFPIYWMEFEEFLKAFLILMSLLTIPFSYFERESGQSSRLAKALQNSFNPVPLFIRRVGLLRTYLLFYLSLNLE